RTHGVPLALGDDAEKAADPHNPSAGNRRDRRFVDRLERRAEGRGPDGAPVEQSRELEVLNVEMPTGDLRWHVGARNGLSDVAEGARRRERRLRVDRDAELPVADQLAIGDARAAALRADDAVGDLEIRHRPTEALGGQGEERLARGRPGATQL